MNTALRKAVPNAVPPAAAATVEVLTEPQLGPYEPMTGSAVNPSVPVDAPDADTLVSPHFTGGSSTTGHDNEQGSQGAPSVPLDGFLFKAQPIDSHYLVESQEKDPYAKVNNPPTRGMWTRVQKFLNGIATSQDTDNAGFKVRHPQQRTSVMLNALPPHGIGYAPETFQPRQLPQATRFNRIQPTTGSDQYGSGQPSSVGGYQPGRVLNSDTYGAGQTAGGVGGSNYTPSPGPPPTNSITAPADTSGMPSWG